MTTNLLFHPGLRFGDPDGTSREITPAEWSKPLYFEADAERPHPSWGEASRSDFPLIGWIPSLCIGTHAGWAVSGKQYARSEFVEHHFCGGFTGGRPVGLTPIQPLT